MHVSASWRQAGPCNTLQCAAWPTQAWPWPTHNIVWEEDPDACCLVLEGVEVLPQVAHAPVHLILAVPITLCCLQAS
jgi:hypothetical protein